MRSSSWSGIAWFLGLAAAACGSEATVPGPDATGAPADPPSAPFVPTAVNPTGASADGGAGAADGAPAPAALTAAKCFEDLAGKVKGPDYDQFHPIIGKSCAGTHHQDIKGVQRLVFLGDSVTEGTPPNTSAQFYRNVLAADLAKKFGSLEVSNCAAWGARMDDLLAGKNEIAKCFPNAVEPKRTLVIMTMGGNDIASWAKDKLAAPAAIVEADKAAGLFRDAMHWFKDQKARFPAGVDVVVTNAYEYTDTTGDLMSCPTAALSGMSGNWLEGAPAVVHFAEQLMKAVVETKTDLVFLQEDFCGHGYKNDDATLQCYRGPDTPRWFDLTCIHPNPAGHAEIARLFRAVIDG